MSNILPGQCPIRRLLVHPHLVSLNYWHFWHLIPNSEGSVVFIMWGLHHLSRITPSLVTFRLPRCWPPAEHLFVSSRFRWSSRHAWCHHLITPEQDIALLLMVRTRQWHFDGSWSMKTGCQVSCFYLTYVFRMVVQKQGIDWTLEYDSYQESINLLIY